MLKGIVPAGTDTEDGVRTLVNYLVRQDRLKHGLAAVVKNANLCFEADKIWGGFRAKSEEWSYLCASRASQVRMYKSI